MAKFTAKQLAVITNAVNAAFDKQNADIAYDEAIEELTKLPEATAKPLVAAEVGKKYGVAVSSKVAERGPKAGQTVWVFGDGASNGKEDTKDGAARVAFGRLCRAAWGGAETSNDADAAEALYKALKKVIAGRAKLSTADKKKFARLAAKDGVSFV